MKDRSNKKWSVPTFGLLDAARDLAARLPSEETLRQLLEEIPRLERLLNSPALEHLGKVAKLVDYFQDGTIDRLVNLPPLLSNIPPAHVMVDIANMKPYLANLPSHTELREMIELLREVKGFLAVLKGGAG